jgi:hypothetical protein
MDLSELIKDPQKIQEIINSKLYRWDGIKNKEDLELVKILLHYTGNSKDIFSYLNYSKEKLDDTLENKLFESPENTLYYIITVIKDRYPKAEPVIARKLETAFEYASKILYGRFYEGEDLISKNSKYSLKYAIEIIGGRFEKGEDAIAQDPLNSLKYALVIMKGRFEKGEASISKRSDTSFIYASRILKDRFKEGEKVIIKNKTYLQNYIRFLKEIGKLEEFLNDYPRIKKKLKIQ